MKQIVPRKPHQTPLPHEKSGKARIESGILIALSRVYTRKISRKIFSLPIYSLLLGGVSRERFSSRISAVLLKIKLFLRLHSLVKGGSGSGASKAHVFGPIKRVLWRLNKIFQSSWGGCVKMVENIFCLFRGKWWWLHCLWEGVEKSGVPVDIARMGICELSFSARN